MGSSWVTRRPRQTNITHGLTYVAELVNRTNGTRDTNLVQQVFWPEDVPIILSIPACEDTDGCLAL